MSGLAHGTVRTRQHRHTWRIISKTPDHFESIRAWKEANPSDSPEEEEEQKAEPSGRKQGQRAR